MQAVVKSFDPGNRGWLSAGQVRRAFTTLGFNPPKHLGDRVPCDVVLDTLKETQETELFNLVAAGFIMEEEDAMEDVQLGSSHSNQNNSYL